MRALSEAINSAYLTLNALILIAEGVLNSHFELKFQKQDLHFAFF